MQGIFEFFTILSGFFTSIGYYLADFFNGILGIFNLQQYIALLNPLAFFPTILLSIMSVSIPVVIALRVIGRDN